MSRDPKATHCTDPLGVPVVREDLDKEAVTPVEVPMLSCNCGGKGLGITIGFSTTNKLISRIIRWITRGKVSHSWVAYDDFTLGLRMVLQAEAWGFEVRPWARWCRENIWVAEFRLINGAQHSALRKRAREIGEKYDYKSAIVAGVISWFRRWVRAKFSFRSHRTPGKLMCSEAVVRFLKDAGCQAVRNLDEELTSPAELYDIVRCSTEFTAVKRER